MASCKLKPEVDDLLRVEANKSPSVSDNAAATEAKTSSSDHEDREEKIDETEEDNADDGVGRGPQRGELSIKNKEVLNSSRAAANNSAGSPTPVDSAPRSKKGQHKKRKTDEDTSSGSKTEEPALKMRIKRKKMTTRQSASRRIATPGDESNSPEEEETPSSLLSESASPRRNSPVRETHPKRESIITEGRRGAKEEKKRKLSSSSSTPGGIGLASPKPTSFSCQHRGRKRSSATLGSSSAPTSPAAQAGAIRSRRSSPAIISTSPATMTAVDANTVGRPLLDGQIDRSSPSPSLTFRANGPSAKTEMSAADSDSDRKSKRESLVSSRDDEESNVKKLKMDTNREEDRIGKSQEIAIPSSISATVTTHVPVGDPLREKPEQHDAGTWVRAVGTSTEAECLGPCEPGTAVTLEGIVWNETKGGILVVNVTWRGKTYVGTLLDCTKYDWAPPQLCDSPSNSENDSLSSSGPGSNSNQRKAGQNGNGRGRKGHGGNRGEAKRQQQAQLANATNHSSNGNGSNESNSDQDQSANEARVKKPVSISSTVLEADSPVLFQCPFGTCEKKFSAIVGLKYHQTSSHRNVICKMSSKHSSHSVGVGSKSGQGEMKPKQEVRAGQTNSDAGPKPKLEQKPNLEDLFKVVQTKPPNQSQDQQQTNSPVYSDISEDDAVVAPPLRPIVDETIAPTALPQLASTATEKPMAIVEPQCASSASTPSRPAPMEQLSAPTLCAPKVVQAGAKVRKETERSLERHDSACPPLLPSLEATSRHKKPGSVGKLEPASPRPTSALLEFAVPALPSSSSNIGRPSSPLPVPTASSSAAHARPPSGSSQHPLNMINQLNHPAFMFHPFNPPNAAMFPGGHMAPQNIFQTQSLGLDSTAAAAAAATLMAAGQQSAGMYGSSAALAAAAGFPVGLHSPPGASHHGSMGLFGGSPMVSMAPDYGSSNLNLSPSTALQVGSNAAYHAQPSGLASRLQQAHKIHELTEHAKRVRSAAGDTSAIVEALRRSQVANTSPSPSTGAVQTQRARQLTPASSIDSDSPQRAALHLAAAKSASRSSAPSFTAVPTPVIASSVSCDSYGSSKAVNPGSGSTACESSKQQQSSLSKMSPSATRGDVLSVSPPVQRHLHTHHHTHTTYPALLASGIDPYSAMVASQQAAAAAVGAVGGYTSFGSSAKP